MIKKLISRVFGGARKKPAPGEAAVLVGTKQGVKPEMLSSGCRRTIDGLQQAGFEAFVVGGAVRDMLLGREPKDFDVATNATPEQVRALFRMTANHLGLDPLYTEVKERIAEMNQYLEADSLRRQANTVVRLTVVTIFGLIGTITTGFLGMNLLAEAEAPIERKLWLFAVVFVLTTALTVYTMSKSKRLSDFLDVLSDERASTWQKCKALALVWRRDGK